MVQTLSISLQKPISAAVLTGASSGGGEDGSSQPEILQQAEAMVASKMQEIEELKQNLMQVISAVQDGASKLKHQQQQSIMENQQQIGLLAVGIAKKILAKEIEEGRYDIKAIIETTLQAAPSREKVTVKLNPVDYAGLNEILNSEDKSSFENITFAPDELIQPGQCVLETPKGIVEYFMDDQLQRIAQALGGVN